MEKTLYRTLDFLTNHRMTYSLRHVLAHHSTDASSYSSGSSRRDSRAGEGDAVGTAGGPAIFTTSDGSSSSLGISSVLEVLDNGSDVAVGSRSSSTNSSIGGSPVGTTQDDDSDGGEDSDASSSSAAAAAAAAVATVANGRAAEGDDDKSVDVPSSGVVPSVFEGDGVFDVDIPHGDLMPPVFAPGDVHHGPPPPDGFVENIRASPMPALALADVQVQLHDAARAHTPAQLTNATAEAAVYAPQSVSPIVAPSPIRRNSGHRRPGVDKSSYAAIRKVLSDAARIQRPAAAPHRNSFSRTGPDTVDDS